MIVVWKVRGLKRGTENSTSPTLVLNLRLLKPFRQSCLSSLRSYRLAQRSSSASAFMIFYSTCFTASLTCLSRYSLISLSSTLTMHVESVVAIDHLLNLVIFYLSNRHKGFMVSKFTYKRARCLPGLRKTIGRSIPGDGLSDNLILEWQVFIEKRGHNQGDLSAFFATAASIMRSASSGAGTGGLYIPRSSCSRSSLRCSKEGFQTSCPITVIPYIPACSRTSTTRSRS